jgi:single-strand DNA-binding protein
MSDYMTFRGFVASEIKTSTTPGGVGTASFRFGSTARRYDKATGTWVDLYTNWFNVQGYRQLAGNMACSIKKGQRVIVVGRLKQRTWEKEGRIYHSAEIDAESVGHDLMWGSANYIRNVNNGPHMVAGSGSAPGAGEQTGDGGLHEPDDGHGDPGEGGHDDDDDNAAAAEIFLVDSDGSHIPVDTETGELAGSTV